MWELLAKLPKQPLMGTILSVVFSGFIAVMVTIWYNQKTRNNEYRSLIVSFALDLVNAFEWCAGTYELSLRDPLEITRGTLNNFIDSGSLTRFASVCGEPTLIMATVDLKSKYQQIARHLENAAIYGIKDFIHESDNRHPSVYFAQKSQETALEFFESYYHEIKSNTAILLLEALKAYPKNIILIQLEDKFRTAQMKVEEIRQKRIGDTINELKIMSKLGYTAEKLRELRERPVRLLTQAEVLSVLPSDDAGYDEDNDKFVRKLLKELDRLEQMNGEQK